MVVERFGRFHTVQQPGWFFAWPVVDRITAVHDMRELCLQVSKQQATTKDNVRLSLEGNVYVRVVDVEKATYNISRPLHAIMRHAEAAMRASVGLFDLDNIFHARAELNHAVLEHLHEACAAWGLKVTRYEVTSVDADAKIAESMDLQAAAERRRRETVKSAMANKEAVILESEGQRERDRNESEGKRIRAVTEAQGFAEQQVLRAEGLRKAKMLEAEGVAYALEKIGQVTATEEGQRALQFTFGTEYVKYMSHLGSKSNSTIFLSQDVGDMSSLLAKGLSLLGSNAFNHPAKIGEEKREEKREENHHETMSHSQHDNLSGDKNEQVVNLISRNDDARPAFSDDLELGGKYGKEMAELRAEMYQYGNVLNRKH